MELNDYQIDAHSTAIFPEEMAIPYLALGLGGEAGEVSNKVKKIIRDRGGVVTREDMLELKKELGDALWYLAVLAHYLGLSLEEVASANLEKLASRKERGVIGGSGDDR